MSLSCLSTSGYELLFQPEVVRVYTSLLRESKNASVLEAAAGAIQNLCAGRWTVSNHFQNKNQFRLAMTTLKLSAEMTGRSLTVINYSVCFLISTDDTSGLPCVWRKVFP